MTYTYTVFGLSFEFPLPCPELLPAAEAGTPDVVVRYGEVPPTLEQPADTGVRWQAASGLYLLDLARIARFLVRDGREIIIQPAEGVREANLRTFLLSSCLAVLLHQRKYFVLHVSGIRAEHGAVLFAGRSGAGKSTTAQAFLQRGYKLLADDMLALTFDENGRVLALPGFPQVKLWEDAAQELGVSTEGWRQVVPGYQKFATALPASFDPRPLPLHALYVLSSHAAPHFKLETLDQTARFGALLNHTWQKLTIPGLGLREWHFRTAAQISATTYMAGALRPEGAFQLNKLADLLENDFNTAGTRA